MTNTMINRVAQAIADAHGFSDLVTFNMYYDLAIAAIKAMREPTEGMEFAGCQPLMSSLNRVNGEDFWDAEGPWQVWTDND